MSIETLHPFTVHFTIALFSASILLDLWGYWRKKDNFRFAGWINLLLAGIAAVFSVGTGLLAESRVDIPAEAAQIFNIHETLAFVIAGGILALLFWRIAARGLLPAKFQKLYLVSGILVWLLVVGGAFFGGKLVYQYGVGVKGGTVLSRDKSKTPLMKPLQLPGPDMFSAEKDSAR